MNARKMKALIHAHGLTLDHSREGAGKFRDLEIGTGGTRKELQKFVDDVKTYHILAIVDTVTNKDHPDYGKHYAAVSSFWWDEAGGPNPDLRGPWHVETRHHVYAIVDAKGRDICYIDRAPAVYNGEEVGHQSSRTRTVDDLHGIAHAIAAAPLVGELVAAVRRSLPDLEHYVSTHGPGPDLRLARLKEAVAKFPE